MFQLQQKKIKRTFYFILSGGSLAFSLFLLMYLMIKPGDLDLESLKNRQMIDFIRIRKDDTLNERDRKLPDKPPPPKRPPPPEIDEPELKKMPTPMLDIELPDIVKTPKKSVSILMPCYNINASYFSKTLESIKNQQYPVFINLVCIITF